jgi:hypothetical protein
MFATQTLITWDNSDQTERGKSSLLPVSMSLLKKITENITYIHIFITGEKVQFEVDII